MKTLKTGITLLAVTATLLILGSCKEKDPSIAKIFVRSNSNELQADVRVVIIADVSKNESPVEYVDTLLTNNSGFVEFNLDDYYSAAGKKVAVANFDILCRKNNLTGTGKIRARVNTTAVETIKITQ
ncbi:MAG TPA: hypothetical protein VKZ44_06605 [Taishania sp.]|nr:hypothetical protein [Taishania sp.]